MTTTEPVRSDERGCGCCGRPIHPEAVWCDDCCEHVKPTGPLWDRTFYSQWSIPCPHQVAL